MSKHPNPEVRIIDEALNILDSPEKWTKKTSARDINDEHININDPNAYKFCILGAMEIASKIVNPPAKTYVKHVYNIMEHLKKHIRSKNKSISRFNDHPNTKYTGITRILHKAKRSIIRESVEKAAKETANAISS